MPQLQCRRQRPQRPRPQRPGPQRPRPRPKVSTAKMTVHADRACYTEHSLSHAAPIMAPTTTNPTLKTTISPTSAPTGRRCAWSTSLPFSCNHMHVLRSFISVFAPCHRILPSVGSRYKCQLAICPTCHAYPFHLACREGPSCKCAGVDVTALAKYATHAAWNSLAILGHCSLDAVAERLSGLSLVDVRIIPS